MISTSYSLATTTLTSTYCTERTLMLLVISCCVSQLLIMVCAKSVSAHPGQTWQVRTSALLPCASKTDSAEVSMAGRSGTETVGQVAANHNMVV